MKHLTSPFCDVCGRENFPKFHILDELWQKHVKDQKICLQCFQMRLGRFVTIQDLKETPLTNTMRLGMEIYEHSISKQAYCFEGPSGECYNEQVDRPECSKICSFFEGSEKLHSTPSEILNHSDLE